MKTKIENIKATVEIKGNGIRYVTMTQQHLDELKRKYWQEGYDKGYRHGQNDESDYGWDD